MWVKLQSVCTHVGQRVVYLIVQALFNYQKVTKLKRYDKIITSIFADVHILTKRLRIALTPNRDIYNSIVIVIAFDSIHDDFDTKIFSFLKISDKKINEIQQIPCSAKRKNLSKQVISVISKLALAFERPIGQYSGAK